MIKFCCEQCGREYKVDDKYAGRKARCKQCDHPSVIPAAQSNVQVQTNDMITFSCGSCSQKLRVKNEYAGKSVKCSNCSEAITIPHPELKDQADTFSQMSLAEEETSRQTDRMVEFSCLMCDAKMQAEESRRGETFECPECQCFVEIPLISKKISEENPSYQDWQASCETEEMPPTDAAVSLSPEPEPSRTSAVPPALKVPAAIATSFAFTIGGAILWSVIASLTKMEFSLIIIAVGSLAGIGLTLYTDKRSTTLGIAAALIGLFGMLTGKALVARYTILPVLNEDIKSEITQGQYGDDFLSAKNPFAVYISGCLEKRDTGEISQDLAWPVFAEFIRSELEKIDENSPESEEVYIWAVLLLGIEPEILESRAEDISHQSHIVQKYIETLEDAGKLNVVNSHKDEIVETYLRAVSKTGLTFGIAFIGSFGLFDLIFIPIGLFTAFNVGSGRSRAKK